MGKRRGLSYREVFFGTFGLGPHACEFCGDWVPNEVLMVHHHDHNRKNDDPGNLVAAHLGCHTASHLRVWRLANPEEYRVLQSTAGVAGARKRWGQ